MKAGPSQESCGESSQLREEDEKEHHRKEEEMTKTEKKTERLPRSKGIKGKEERIECEHEEENAGDKRVNEASCTMIQEALQGGPKKKEELQQEKERNEEEKQNIQQNDELERYADRHQGERMGMIADGADQEVKMKEGARWKGERGKEDEEKKNTQVQMNAMAEDEKGLEKEEKGKEKERGKEKEKNGTEEEAAKEKEEKQKRGKRKEDQAKKESSPVLDKITAEKGMEVSAPHRGPSNLQEGLENGSQKNSTGKWVEWRKHDRQGDSLTELKLTLFRLAKEDGLEVFDVGQGRGGECQYLSVLCTIDPTSYVRYRGKYQWNVKAVDSFRAEVAKWMRKHGDHWIGGETFRTLALTEWKGWTEGMSLAEEQRQLDRYLVGVSEARRGQWGDNFTMVAISGLLKRMVVVLSVGPSKKLSKFEIEPPDHLSEGESCGVPLILSHFGDHHYMPVRVQRDGPWGWVLPKATKGDGGHVPARSSEVVVMDVPPRSQGMTSSRNFSPQRRSDLLSVVLRARQNRQTLEFSPMTGRISSPQRRLVMRDLVRRSSFGSREVGVGAGFYGGEMTVGRSLSAEKWFAERAASLARGAESEEEWSSAWGIVKKEKHKGRESMENGSYAGKRQVVGGATEVGMRGGGWADGGRADGGQTR